MRTMLVLVFSGLLGFAAAHADSGPPELQRAVKAWMKSIDPNAPVVKFHIFDQPGAPLAAAFVEYVPEGGNHVFRAGTVFERGASGWAPTGVDLDVFGDIVGGRAVAADKVLVEGKVLGPGDSNCCPTHPKTWTVELRGSKPSATGASQSHGSQKAEADAEAWKPSATRWTFSPPDFSRPLPVSASMRRNRVARLPDSGSGARRTRVWRS